MLITGLTEADKGGGDNSPRRCWAIALTGGKLHRQQRLQDQWKVKS